MTDTFIFHTDAGHGWLEVSWRDLKDLSLNPKDFSRYSYRRGNTFYLEEDCDAYKFVQAWKDKHHQDPQFGDQYQEHSFIRNLPSIHS
jgi:hypothetical protein